MYELDVFLKGGQTIRVKCTDWSFDTNNDTGEFTGYNLEGLVPPSRFEVVPSQIAGYIQL